MWAWATSHHLSSDATLQLHPRDAFTDPSWRCQLNCFDCKYEAEWRQRRTSGNYECFSLHVGVLELISLTGAGEGRSRCRDGSSHSSAGNQEDGQVRVCCGIRLDKMNLDQNDGGKWRNRSRDGQRRVCVCENKCFRTGRMMRQNRLKI